MEAVEELFGQLVRKWTELGGELESAAPASDSVN